MFLPLRNIIRRLPHRCKAARCFSTEHRIIPTENTRNIAIIAHVDHGKTTLVDCLLRQSDTRVGDGDRVMDSNDLEQERGITILAKNTSVLWKCSENGEDYRFNIIDTPGHADFGGEVERIMSMVDGVALVVDATDGPMTQTKFVLSKALAKGLSPFVIVNKIDRDTSRGTDVYDEVFELFDQLGASDEQLDFPIVYASARDGWAVRDCPEHGDQLPPQSTKGEGKGMLPVYENIRDHVPAPNVDEKKPFSMLISMIDRHPHFGKVLVGRVQSGTVGSGSVVKALDQEGKVEEETAIAKILFREGLEQIPVDQARAGDIVSIAAAGGWDAASVNSTLIGKADEETVPIPAIPIDPPTLKMRFSVNNSPLAGKQSNGTTAAQLAKRLLRESEVNVSIRVEQAPDSNDAYEVYGRGELQLAVLIETMRREGMEISISPPKVVLRQDESDESKLLEPMEEVVIDVPEDYTGSVIEKLSSRKGMMMDYVKQGDNNARLTFHVPTRGLIGYGSEFINDTKASGTLNHSFHEWVEHVGEIRRSRKGALIARSDGTATSHALNSLEARGTLFISPGQEVYEGMVIGESKKEGDMDVNPVRTKQLTNIRTKSSDEMVRLVPPVDMSLEQVIAYVKDDEMIDVTADHVRLRKAILSRVTREINAKQAKKERNKK